MGWSISMEMEISEEIKGQLEHNFDSSSNGEFCPFLEFL